MGCSWCYASGEYSERSMRYPITENQPDIRTHDQYLIDIANAEALSGRNNIRDVKGFTSLKTMPYFDCIWGFPIEYMHEMVLGVARQIWKLWTKLGTPYYFRANAQTEMNLRLLNIQPPQEIFRLPRSLKSRTKWKASEWYSWLLFYSIPCLTGILQQDALKS